jgi:hypothetical protein
MVGPGKGRRERLGNILLRQGVLSEQRLELITRQRLLGDAPVARLLLQLGWVSPGDLARALAEQAHRQYVPGRKLVPDSARARELPLEMLRRLRVFPVAGEHLHTFAVSSPRDVERMDELERLCGCHVEMVVTEEPALDLLLEEDEPPTPDGFHEQLSRERRRRVRTPVPDGIECFYAFFDRADAPLLKKAPRGELRDISDGGACIEGPIPMDLHDRLEQPDVTLKANVFAEEIVPGGPIRTRGLLRWIGGSQTHVVHFGVSWRPVSDSDRMRLDRLVMAAYRQAADPPS